MSKLRYIALIVLGCVASTILVTAVWLHSDRVQTGLVRVVTDELSRGLGSTVCVGQIESQWPARLCLKDVYVSDQQGDTLAYMGEMYMHFSPMGLLHRTLHFRRVEVLHVRANVHSLPTGEMNYMYLVRAFSSPKKDEDDAPDASSSHPMDIEVGTLRVEDLSGQYEQYDFSLAQLEAKGRKSQDGLKAYGDVADAWVAADGNRFCLTRLRAGLEIDSQQIAMPTLELTLPHSHLDAGGVKLNRQNQSICLHVKRAKVSPCDIALFLPKLQDVKGVFAFSADVDGNRDSLYAQDLELSYNNRRILLGDVEIHTPAPAVDGQRVAPYVRAECRELNLDYAMVQDLVSQINRRPFLLPDAVKRLGRVRYRGLLEGKLPNLRLKGAFRTDVGTITTDASMDSTFTIDGHVASRRLALGRVLPESSLGNVSFDIDGSLSPRDGEEKRVHGKVHGHVNELTYHDYTYRDICLHGRYDKGLFEGRMTMEDKNAHMVFDGLIHKEQAGEMEMNFDLRLDSVRPGQLHLIAENHPLHSLELGLRLSTELTGGRLDDMNGYVVVDSIRLQTDVDSMMVEQMKLMIEGQGLHHKLLLTATDLLTARLEGDYSYATLPSTLAKFAVRHVPGLFTGERAQQILSQESNNRLNVYFYGHQLQHLERLLCTPVRVGDYPVLKAFVNEQKSVWGVRGLVPTVVLRNGTRIRDITLSADNLHDRANLGLSLKADSVPVLVQMFAAGDSIGLKVETPDRGKSLRGRLETVTHIRQYAGRPLLSMHLHESDVAYCDSVFHIGDAVVEYAMADTAISISHLRIESGTESIFVDGVASKLTDDSLNVRLRNVDAAFVMPMLLPPPTLTVGGRLTGEATLYGLMGRMRMVADVVLCEAELNETPLGTAIASCRLDKEAKQLLIDGDVYRNDGYAEVRDNHLTAHVDGVVPLGTRTWMLDIRPDSIPLGFINHWTSSFLDDVDGFGSGDVRIEGDKGKVYITAKVQPHDAHFTLPWTGCTYWLQDSCYLDSTGIYFPNMMLRDEDGNPVHVDGAVKHNSFKDWDFRFDVDIRHALALNLPPDDASFMNGYVLGAGQTHVRGDDHAIRVNADAVTGRGSRFALTIDNASSAGDNSFVTFVDHNKVEIVDEAEEELKRWIVRSNHARMFDSSNRPSMPATFQMGLNVDVTPDVDFRLMLNSRTGDMIEALGEGALTLRIEETGDVRLLGTYELQSGKMGYTVANAIHKELTIVPGSTIVWNGDPMNPNLKVRGYYQTTASLTDLFGSEREAVKATNTRNQIPVRVVVDMTGDFDDPTLHFSLELPSCDDAIRQQVMSVINTEEMLLRQVVYLLVFNKFYTPDYMAAHTAVGLNETYSLVSSTVTGQINAWLSKLTDVVSLGVAIRRDGEVGDATAQTEYEANFQIQPVPRLVINGNVGYRYNDVQNRPFFGDLDVEYKLTRNGKLSAKAYTHMVDKYSLRQAYTIQGIGLVLRHDFNWPRILKRDKQKKKQNEPAHQ